MGVGTGGGVRGFGINKFSPPMYTITAFTTAITVSSLIGLNEKIAYSPYLVITCAYLLFFAHNLLFGADILQFHSAFSKKLLTQFLKLYKITLMSLGLE